MNTTGKFQIEDISPEVIKLDQEWFPNPWTDSGWKELDLKTHGLFCYRENSRLLAFALLGMLKGDTAAHLYKILLVPERRGDGTIAVFWQALKEAVKASGFSSIYLEVEASNERAVGFYRKVGFTILHRKKGYYSSGEDGLMMSLTL